MKILVLVALLFVASSGLHLSHVLKMDNLTPQRYYDHFYTDDELKVL